MNRAEMSVDSRLNEIENELNRVVTFLRKVTAQEEALQTMYSEITENIEGVNENV